MVLPPGLKTAREVKAFYDQRYETLIASGEYVPFLYPWMTIGAAVVLIYLLFDHRKSPTLKALRFPVYGFLVAFSAWSILNNKARSAAGAYGVGLVSSWGTLWTGAIMFVNDCQVDFKRIDRADSEAVKKLVKKDQPHTNGSIGNGTATGTSTGNDVSQTVQDLSATEQLATQLPYQRTGPLFWQSYPARPFLERVDWVADIFCSFRGVGWNRQTNGIPPLPDWVEDELKGQAPLHAQWQQAKIVSTSRTGIRRFTSSRALMKDTLIRLFLGAAILDITKTFIQHDPYFWGYMSAAPPTWLPFIIRSSPILTKSYRLLVSLTGIITALTEIFRLGPLFFHGILGVKVIGVRGEPWMNPPDCFGSFSAVLSSGIAGWWGSFWHQMFRFAFEAPATKLLSHFNIPKRSQRGKLISLTIAFFLSGCLHACGSYTQLGDTRPLAGPFLFFQLQTVGIVGQMLVSQQLRKSGIVTDKTPKILRQITNFLVTMVWMYFTAPLLVDDFAKGGVWLYEPLVFSPLRALGFGAEDDRSWDLWYGLVFWRRGKHWWDTGLAF